MSSLETTQAPPQPVPQVRAWPPRRLDATEAAYMLGVSTSKFAAGVKQGRYPAAIKDGGNTLWDYKVLERYCDETAGLAREGDKVANGEAKKFPRRS